MIERARRSTMRMATSALRCFRVEVVPAALAKYVLKCSSSRWRSPYEMIFPIKSEKLRTTPDGTGPGESNRQAPLNCNMHAIPELLFDTLLCSCRK
jgi:hypothetical protein